MSLARRINPLQLLLISMNGMIGSAWLFAPLYAAKIAGSGAIYAWLIGGFMTLLVALNFAELSSRFPVAGGTAQIPEISFGKLTGFMTAWSAWLSALIMSPIEVQAVLQYASTYIPSLIAPATDNVVRLSGIGYLAALALMGLMAIINIASFRGFVGSNKLIFAYKMLIILLIIGLIPSQRFHAANFHGSINDGIASLPNIMSAVALGGIAFAFTGFKHGVELAGEAHNQRIAIPVAIGGSVLACLILYLALQIVFIGALTPSSLQAGWANLHFAGDVGPFAGILLSLGAFWLLKLLYVDAAVSPLGAGLIYMTSTARIVYAVSRRGQLPAFFTKTNKQKLPTVAIFLNVAIGMFAFVPLKGWQAMTDFLVSLMVISYAMGPLSLMVLSPSKNQSHKTFKLPCRWLLCPLAFYCCNLLSYWTGWQTLSKLAVLLLAGFVIFLIGNISKNRRHDLGLRALIWLVPYFAGLIAISYAGNFGGHKLIPFGMDFVILAIFSLVIMMLACLSRRTDKQQAESSLMILPEA